MYYKLNLWFKTFGLNKTANMCLILDDEEQVKTFLKGYEQLIKCYELYLYEFETTKTIQITKRTKLNNIYNKL